MRRVVPKINLECAGCGVAFQLWPSQAVNRIYCTRRCGAAHRRVGYIERNGYRCFTIDTVEVREHRMVIERSIGRKLFAHETVHHRNGNKLDNRIENLELWSSRHGRGQRVEDKLAFAKSLLEEYGAAHFSLSPDAIALGALAMGG